MTKSNTEVEIVETDELELKSKRDPNFVPTKSLKARGSLSVDKSLSGADDDGQSVQVGTLKKEAAPEITPLPEMGTVFNINGFEYKVNYINIGQGRFSSIPV